MGPGDKQLNGGADAARTAASNPLRRALQLTGPRRALLLAPLTLLLVLAIAATAAAAATPRWEIISNHGPTNVPRTHALPQQWTLTEAGTPNVGRFKIEVEVPGKKAQKTKYLPFNATHTEVQTELEELTHVGKNVTVTGGPTSPGQAEWSYVISFVGELEGLNLPTVEVEQFEATLKEKKEVEEKKEEPAEAELEFEETHKASRNTVIYQIIPTNLGSAPTSGLITLTDKLPAGLVTLESPEALGGAWKCTPEGEGQTEVKCTSEKVVNPDSQGESIFIRAYANPNVIKEGERLTNTVSISGGGAPVTATPEHPDEALVSETPAPFGAHFFKAATFNANGEKDTIAGDHPYAATTTFFFNTVNKYAPWEQEWEVLTPGNLKDANVILPEGFIGNPAGPFVKGVGRQRCAQPEFLLGAKGEPGEQTHLGCPAGTQVGTATLFINSFTREPTVVPVYNLSPPAGVPAEFGFLFANTPVRLDAHVRRINGKYRLTVLSPDINEAFNISGLSLTLWGTPAEASHDAERNKTENHAEKGAKNEETPVRPFLTNPADCVTQAQEHPVTVLRYDQWESPGANNSEGEPLVTGGDPTWHEEESERLPAVTGCNELHFEPAVESGPRPIAEGGSSQVSAPSGYQFKLEIPQHEEVGVKGTPQLKDTVVTLPEGVTLSPSAANGLQGCSPGQINLESTAKGNCPAGAKVGEVHIHSELLEEELTGSVYIGEPECSPCSEKNDVEGKLYKLYIEAEAAQSGVRIKLPGSAIAGNKETAEKVGAEHLAEGQVRSTFANNPQLPFTKLTLTLKGKERATLANPAVCGNPATTTLLTPWSIGGNVGEEQILGTTTPPITSGYGTAVSWDGAGAPCPSSLPFAPSFAAGTENSQAGAYSPFVTVFKRTDDREQTFNGITVHTPPGLLGRIKGVDKCEASPLALEKEETQCPTNSRIATATTAAGSGTEPFVVSGPVYLTGESTSAKTGVKGPFGLDIVVPAKAGPFNLGTVVVHAIINIDKSTGALTIVSDPLPQSIDGTPFRVKEVQVRVDRPEFMFNPTNCEAGAGHEITASLTGLHQKAEEADAASQAAVPITATGCASLPFNPNFTAASDAKFSKHTGASLTVKVSEQPGEANIRKVELQLPEALPSQLETLHKACPDYVFEANPATCPAGSTVGYAKAVTPLLNSPLEGPAILVSHANLAFPDLVYLLQGEGVHIELVGNTNIEHGITYSKFETVPDAPISTFETVIPRGEHALLTAYGNLCEKELIAPTTIVSQSNKEIKQNTVISVAECPPGVSVLAAKSNGRQVMVTVRLTQAGNVQISGAGLKTTVKRGVSAGTHKIAVPLTAAGKAAHRTHRKLTVLVKVTAGGKSGTATTKAKA